MNLDELAKAIALVDEEIDALKDRRWLLENAVLLLLKDAARQDIESGYYIKLAGDYAIQVLYRLRAAVDLQAAAGATMCAAARRALDFGPDVTRHLKYLEPDALEEALRFIRFERHDVRVSVQKFACRAPAGAAQ